MKRLACLTTLTPLLLGAAFGSTIVDSVNQSEPVCSGSGCNFVVDDVGWFYTAPFSYTLTSVDFKFGSTDGRSVTEEVFTSPTPAALGGTLLGSATFVPVADSFAGGSLSPISIIGGDIYLIGILNVNGLDGPFTLANGAQNLLGASGTGGTFTSGPNYFPASGNVIMELIGTSAVPEPSSLSLLAVGLALAFFARKRCSRAVTGR
ncbi:MAG: PEP-CTERM sorting domain-containing protein [Acidobacteriaceae bacterium]|nr:PEP-CTERM sorting domain-containing protein [Acidobacteriaceae bacterium]